MKYVYPLRRIHEEEHLQVGGKFVALARMATNGIRVPDALCIGADAYRAYLAATGLAAHLQMEVYRKNETDMRWEELWDTSLRIRNRFSTTFIPTDLRELLVSEISKTFPDRSVAVRSSALGEDSSGASFAGMHDSFLNIQGVDAVLDAIRLVWASLWSDRALLYRRDLNLDVMESAMPVVVQEMVVGERSGVAFGKNPMDEAQAVIEAVFGLNEGLVDGAVEPHRWILDRSSGRILDYRSATETDTGESPLAEADVRRVFDLVRRLESIFGSPQDVEWTIKGDALYALQSRPITTTSANEEKDDRQYYFELHRSLDNLKELRRKIEEWMIPALQEEAEKLSETDLTALSDDALAAEIEQREASHKRWLETYAQYCIPFAHGMRLFGQFYNDVMRPENPFEFFDLLAGSELVSTRRNRQLLDMADMVRQDPALAESLDRGEIPEHPAFREALDSFTEQYRDLTWKESRFLQSPQAIFPILLQMARQETNTAPAEGEIKKNREEAFLSSVQKERRAYAEELLDIGKASYALRDNDNTFIGRIDGQRVSALSEGKRRLSERIGVDSDALKADEILKALRDSAYIPRASLEEFGETTSRSIRWKARQLVGQPAGPGVAVGTARVIRNHADLFAFEKGEILICDAIDPNMTFVVPLASGIVERRGGMLIHGAIIAREYGLPCVTGVPDVVESIETGTPVTVDGYLGLIIVGEATY